MTTARDRLIEAAADLFMQQGFSGTGLKQISNEAGAPIGSIYHHFPGGKDELAGAALQLSGANYQLLVESVLDSAPDVVTGLHDCFNGAASVLEATDYADACPIETVALEVASTNEALRQVTATVFENWFDSMAHRFAAAGLDKAEARRLAIAFISLLEGAFILSRAQKSIEPMAAARDATVAIVEQALHHD